MSEQDYNMAADTQASALEDIPEIQSDDAANDGGDTALNVSPKDFLRELFSALKDDPKTALEDASKSVRVYHGNKTKHLPHMFTPAASALGTGSALYTAIASFFPADGKKEVWNNRKDPDSEPAKVKKGTVLARNSCIYKVHMIMLDDIGTKFPAPALAPTAKVMSSERNEQWIYKLSEPISKKVADEFMKRMKLSPIADPGAFTSARKIRLPWGINGKKNDDGDVNLFRVHLTHWDPGTTFTIEQLVQEWNLPEVTPEKIALRKVINKVGGGDGNILDGERNTRLYAIGCAMRARGCEAAEIVAEMLRVNQLRCSPALPETEVIDSAESAATQPITSLPINLLDAYAFVESEGKWFKYSAYGCITSASLNIIHGVEYPGGPDTPKAAAWLSQQPRLRKVWGLTWLPCPYGQERQSKDVQVGAHSMANTWEGFALTPSAGDVQPWLNHVDHIVPNKTHQRYVIQRLAFDIQHPDKKCNWQIVIQGIHGAGKDALMTPIMRIFGEAAGTVGNDDVKSSYDDGFVKKKLVIISEVNDLRDDALEAIKRKSASEGADYQLMNPKKEAKITQPNLWSLVFLTNHPDAMKMSPNERRFFVLRADTVMSKTQRDEYFPWLKNDGPAALMDFLLNVDLSDFDPNILPERTPAFYEMIAATDNDLEATLKTWELDREQAFKFDLVLPSELRTMLVAHNIKYSEKAIKTVLLANGWMRVAGQPRKKGINAVRGYFVKRSSPAAGYKDGEFFDEIKKIEEARRKRTING